MKFVISRTVFNKFNDFNDSEFKQKKSPYKDTYNENGVWYIDIETLEELIEFSKKVNNELIVSGTDFGFNTIVPYIEIYDSFRE